MLEIYGKCEGCLNNNYWSDKHMVKFIFNPSNCYCGFGEDALNMLTIFQRK